MSSDLQDPINPKDGTAKKEEKTSKKQQLADNEETLQDSNKSIKNEKDESGMKFQTNSDYYSNLLSINTRRDNFSKQIKQLSSYFIVKKEKRNSINSQRVQRELEKGSIKEYFLKENLSLYLKPYTKYTCKNEEQNTRSTHSQKQSRIPELNFEIDQTHKISKENENNHHHNPKKKKRKSKAKKKPIEPISKKDTYPRLLKSIRSNAKNRKQIFLPNLKIPLLTLFNNVNEDEENNEEKEKDSYYSNLKWDNEPKNKILFEPISLQLAKGGLFEPFFCSFALYDLKEKTKITESWYYEFPISNKNQTKKGQALLKAMQKIKGKYHRSTRTKKCVFPINDLTEDVFLIIKIYKIWNNYENDESIHKNVYTKSTTTTKPVEKNIQNLHDDLLNTVNNFGLFYQPFCWTILPLVLEQPDQLSKKYTDNFQIKPLYLSSHDLIREKDLFNFLTNFKSGTTKKQKIIQGSFEIKMQLIKNKLSKLNYSFYSHNLELINYPSKKKEKEKKKENSKEKKKKKENENSKEKEKEKEKEKKKKRKRKEKEKENENEKEKKNEKENENENEKEKEKKKKKKRKMKRKRKRKRKRKKKCQLKRK